MDRFLTSGRLAAVAILATGLVLAAQHPAMAGDAAHGKAVFTQQCGVCHSAAKGGGAIVGPSLFGVVGRQAGSVKGFNYSSAMKAAGFAWSADKLHAYVAAPSNVVPGNHMPYAGLKNPAQLDDLLAYLATLN
jgi:cytochrome c